MDKSLRDLIEIIHFTENVSVKIHSVLDEADIYRAVMDEFVNSKRYNVSIVLLTDDGSKLKIAGTSLAPKKLKTGEKVSGLRLKDYRIDLNKSSIYSQVVREGKTLQANSRDIMSELFSRPLVHLLSKIIDFKNEKSIVTPLKLHGKIIGALTMSSTDLAEHFIPSVKNLAQHISIALEMANEQAERKKAEKALKESEKKYRELVDLLPQIVFEFDERGFFTFANRKGFESFGYTPEDFEKGLNALQMFISEDRERAKKNIQRKLSGEKFVGTEYTALRKDGSTFPVIIYSSPIVSENKSVGLRGIVIDITERKKAEERIRESEEKVRQYSEHLEELVRKRTEELLESEKRYSVLVEEASDGVVIIQEGKVVFANKKAAEIIGYSRDEIIGLPFEKVVNEKYLQLATEGYMRIMQGETVPPIAELELIAKNGERVPIEASSTFIHYQSRPSNLVLVRDIGERKRMEEQRLKLERLAAVGEVATMVGHDLRNPLQSIEIATYYLNDELPRLSPSIPIPQKTMEMLKVINNSVNYADKIIRDLHDFSATRKPTLKKTSINTIVKETLSQVEIPEKVKLITKLGHLPEIKADKDMIKRAFLNLAINAIQAVEKGGTLKVSTKKTRSMIEVSFKDTGAGMSKEDMKKIFTPFFSKKAKGMGVGLAICKRFVDSHGGSIEVESEEGKGSTFTVKLPIQQENGGENQWRKINSASS